jgi:hypothetical protein
MHESFPQTAFARDHPDSRRLDARESQPISADDGSQGLRHHVTNACVQVESGKGARVHSSLDQIAGAAIWRRRQILGRRSDRKLEPVAKRHVGRALQHLPYDLVLVAAGPMPRPAAPSGRCPPLTEPFCAARESCAEFARPIRQRISGDNRGSSLELIWNAIREVEFK